MLAWSGKDHTCGTGGGATFWASISGVPGACCPTKGNLKDRYVWCMLKFRSSTKKSQFIVTKLMEMEIKEIHKSYKYFGNNFYSSKTLAQHRRNIKNTLHSPKEFKVFYKWIEFSSDISKGAFLPTSFCGGSWALLFLQEACDCSKLLKHWQPAAEAQYPWE